MFFSLSKGVSSNNLRLGNTNLNFLIGECFSCLRSFQAPLGLRWWSLRFSGKVWWWSLRFVRAILFSLISIFQTNLSCIREISTQVWQCLQSTNIRTQYSSNYCTHRTSPSMKFTLIVIFLWNPVGCTSELSPEKEKFIKFKKLYTL